MSRFRFYYINLIPNYICQNSFLFDKKFSVTKQRFVYLYIRVVTKDDEKLICGQMSRSMPSLTTTNRINKSHWNLSSWRNSSEHHFSITICPQLHTCIYSWVSEAMYYTYNVAGNGFTQLMQVLIPYHQ